MGVWGTGLYSGDFAADLREMVGAVARLPFDGNRLMEILRDLESETANNPKDEDYSNFWLVVADQFAKRGIDCPAVRGKALQIIDEGQDIACLADLGMTKADLRKRQKMLDDLRSRLATASSVVKRRAILKKPQPYLMEIGDVFVYPTSRGACINPYASPAELIQLDWKPDAWSAAIVVDRGRALDFLTWYRPLTIVDAFIQKPSLAQLKSVAWVLRRPGTLTALHLQRMEFARLDKLPVDLNKLKRAFPDMPSGFSDAVSDISIANHLSIRPFEDWERRPDAPPRISRLAQILS